MVDAAAPTISDFEPADGTNTSVENPTLQFDATDDGSGFDATTPASHFEVMMGSQLDADGENPMGGVALGGDSGYPTIVRSGD